MEKCYSVVITGRVQNLGFRDIIERTAAFLEIRGYVFNAKNGSVQMVCCGEIGDIGTFLGEIRTRGEKKGAEIKNIAKEEMPLSIPLPEKFIRVYAEELEDISRKLSDGINILKVIGKDTSELPAIRKDVSVLPEIKTGIDSLNTKFDSFIIGQGEHNQRMDEHNLRLEKILEKLAEK